MQLHWFLEAFSHKVVISNEIITLHKFSAVYTQMCLLYFSALQFFESPHACGVSFNGQYCWGWSCLLLFLHGSMPPDQRFHNPKHLPWGTTEGPWSPGLRCPTHVTHPVSPWCQPSAPRPHQGNLQPLHQADLETHSQVAECYTPHTKSGGSLTVMFVNFRLALASEYRCLSGFDLQC